LDDVVSNGYSSNDARVIAFLIHHVDGLFVGDCQPQGVLGDVGDVMPLLRNDLSGIAWNMMGRKCTVYDFHSARQYLQPVSPIARHWIVGDYTEGVFVTFTTDCKNVHTVLVYYDFEGKLKASTVNMDYHIPVFFKKGFMFSTFLPEANYVSVGKYAYRYQKLHEITDLTNDMSAVGVLTHDNGQYYYAHCNHTIKYVVEDYVPKSVDGHVLTNVCYIPTRIDGIFEMTLSTDVVVRTDCANTLDSIQDTLRMFDEHVSHIAVAKRLLSTKLSFKGSTLASVKVANHVMTLIKSVVGYNDKYNFMELSTITSDNLSLVTKRDWLLSHKVDGERVMVVSTLDRHFVLDGKSMIWDVGPSSFRNYVYEGEYVHSSSSIIIHDCLMYDKMILSRQPYRNRIKYLKEYQMPGCQLIPKLIDVSSRVIGVDVSYPHDGYVLMDPASSYVVGLSHNYKWKFEHLNTADIYVETKKGKTVGYYWDDGLRVLDDPISPCSISDVIVEARWNVNMTKWEFVKARPDKARPNALFVIDMNKRLVTRSVSFEIFRDSMQDIARKKSMSFDQSNTKRKQRLNRHHEAFDVYVPPQWSTRNKKKNKEDSVF
jgi:hypothetical protein